MKIFSNTLGTEIEVSVYSKEDNGRKLNIIPHKWIDDFANNKAYKMIPGFQKKTIIEHISDTLTFARCIVTDGLKEVEEFGEARDGSLDSEISKNYASTMACNRALDKAILTFLELPNKYYSDLEIKPDLGEEINNDVVTTKPNTKNSKEELPKEKLPKEKIIEDAFEETQTMDEVAEIEETPIVEVAPVETPLVEEVKEEVIEELPTAAPVDTSMNEPIDDGGDFIIPSGRNKGKSIAEADNAWKSWMKKTLDNGMESSLDKDLVEAYKKYASSHEIA